MVQRSLFQAAGNKIGVKKAAAQLGLPYYTLADWRNNSKHKIRLVEQLNETDADRRIKEPEKENAELGEANEILKDALGFFAKGRKR